MLNCKQSLISLQREWGGKPSLRVAHEIFFCTVHPRITSPTCHSQSGVMLTDSLLVNY